MYLNKVYIIGNLTRDPELKALPSGTKVANFAVATNRVSRDKDGNRQESTEYHNIVAFARLGELAAQYLKKGSQVLVEGRLQTRSWEQDGNKRYRTEIIADNVQFGARPGAASASPSGPASPASAKTDGAKEPASGGEAIEYPQDDINPNDIPF